MNVKELDSGSTPVWRFAVVALSLLGLSILGMWLAAKLESQEVKQPAVVFGSQTTSQAPVRYRSEVVYVPE